MSPTPWKRQFKRRAILPSIIITCIMLYAYMFISYLSRSNQSIETAIHENPNSFVIESSHSTQRRRSCNILVAHGGDDGAGFATLVYSYPINFILYALKYNYTLWLDYKPSYNELYYDKEYGPNVFQYYFDGIEPNWNVCDKKKSKYKILTQREILPGIHKKEPGSIHLWYYHFKIQKIEYDPDEYLEDWYYDQRYRGSEIVKKYFHLKPDIIKQREDIWKYVLGNNKNIKYEVLGVQMRGSDKVQRWSIRRTVKPQEYMPYISGFVDYYGERAKIFFATDDKNYLKFLQTNWNQYVNGRSFDDVVVTQGNVTRSSDKTAIFNFKHVSKYMIGREVLLDILLLAECDWFIHSASAVSEAVFFNNIKLHNHSIHMEYTVNRQIPHWYPT